jgi:hypothetical protein
MMQVTDDLVRVAVVAMEAAENRWRADTAHLNASGATSCPNAVRARAALTAALAAMWRPIEEAPDSETVIVGGGDAVYPVTASWCGRFDEGDGWQVDGQEDIHCEIGWPTHFMPLPSPPKAEG